MNITLFKIIKIWPWYCIKTPDRTGEHHWNNLLKQTGCWLGNILLSISNNLSQHAYVSKIWIIFFINRCCCNAAGCYLWSVCCWLSSACQQLSAKRQDVSKYWQRFDLLFLNTPQPINTENQQHFPVQEVITELTHFYLFGYLFESLILRSYHQLYCTSMSAMSCVDWQHRQPNNEKESDDVQQMGGGTPQGPITGWDGHTWSMTFTKMKMYHIM